MNCNINRTIRFVFESKKLIYQSSIHIYLIRFYGIRICLSITNLSKKKYMYLAYLLIWAYKYLHISYILFIFLFPYRVSKFLLFFN